ncbi:Antibiotic biosynthesis monooxygenase [Penicillium expansum]|nr:Antibiotic biosynthesis monooxygenase [Penicillium expansum]
MVTLYLDFFVQPNGLDTFMGLLHDTLESASNEPQFLSSEVLLFPEEPNRVLLIENWAADQKWMAEVIVTDLVNSEKHPDHLLGVSKEGLYASLPGLDTLAPPPTE